MTERPIPEARRRTILEAAIGVFAQHGFDAATTNDIARAAGLSKGGLYWHFKSKDDILAAILMLLFDQELGVLQELIAAEGAVAPRLRRLVARGTADMLQFEQLLPVILEFYALAARHSDVRQFLQHYYLSALSRVAHGAVQSGLRSWRISPRDGRSGSDHLDRSVGGARSALSDRAGPGAPGRSGRGCGRVVAGGTDGPGFLVVGHRGFDKYTHIDYGVTTTCVEASDGKALRGGFAR